MLNMYLTCHSIGLVFDHAEPALLKTGDCSGHASVDPAVPAATPGGEFLTDSIKVRPKKPLYRRVLIIPFARQKPQLFWAV